MNVNEVFEAALLRWVREKFDATATDIIHWYQEEGVMDGFSGTKPVYRVHVTWSLPQKSRRLRGTKDVIIPGDLQELMVQLNADVILDT